MCDAFTRALDLPLTEKVKRNIGQARDGGNDIDVFPLVIECKRRKTLTVVGQWMAQAEKAAAEKGDIFEIERTRFPVVVGREDEGQSLIIMRLDDFFTLFGDELKARYAAR